MIVKISTVASYPFVFLLLIHIDIGLVIIVMLADKNALQVFTGEPINCVVRIFTDKPAKT
jgi:hypothetical protein